jgi:ATP synthase protein I
MADPRKSRRQPEDPSKVTSDLARRIAQAKQQRDGEQQANPRFVKGELSGLGRAVRLGSEFISAVLIGAAIGYVADQWLGTRPWIMLVMLLVGFAAGILNVTRAVAEMNRASPPPAGSDRALPDDDEDDT